MPPDAPETSGETVQADAIAAAIEAASADLGRGPAAEPEAMPQGTGPADGQATSSEGESTPPPAGEQPVLNWDELGQVNWADEQARREALEGLVGQERQQAERRLNDQRETLVRDLREQAQREAAREELLQELDQLRDEDAAAYADRISNDPIAAAAVLERNAREGGNELTQVRMQWANAQKDLMFHQVPLLAEAAQQLAADPNAASEQLKDGVYAWMQRVVATRAIEDWKQSEDGKAWARSIERDAVHNALPGIGGPPPAERSRVPSGRVESNTGDPLKDAVAAAAAATGRQVNLDLIAEPGPRRSGRR